MTALLERPGVRPVGRHRKARHHPVVTPGQPADPVVPGPPRAARHRKPPGPIRLPVMPIRMADLAVVASVAGAVALMEVPGALRAVCLVVFIATGPGSAVLTWARIPRRVMTSTVPVLGMAIVTLTAIIALWSHRWTPLGILWVQVVAVAGSSAFWYYRTGSSMRDATRGWSVRTVARSSRRPFARQHLSLILSGAAVALWVAALPGLAGVDADYYGLLFSGSGPLLAVCIVLCSAALVVAIRDRVLVPAAAALAAAIIVSRMTTFVATEVPLYDWTYKHLAVVDYITTHGRLAPDGTDIYAQWPAFFAAWAWFCEVTGVSPMTVAHLFAPAIHVLIALTVYTAARVLGRSRRTALTAAFLAEVTNWVGQDYFSPQAWSLVLSFGMLTMLLASPRSRACGVLAIVVFTATVPSHQLTPFWAVAVVSLLCLVKRARPWWIAVAMAAIAASYLLLNLEAVLPYGLLSGGSPISNAASNIQTSGLPAKDFTSAVVRSLSIAVVLAAVAAAIWSWRQKKPVLGLVVVSFSSFGLLLGQSYGGEAIFRVYLYSLLGAAILIAPALVHAVSGPVRGIRRAASGSAAVLGLAGASLAGLHGYVALWPIVFETRAQVDLMDGLTENADVRTRLVMLRHGGMPTRINARYADLTLHNPYFDEPISYDLWSGQDPRLPELRAGFPSEEDLGMLQDYATRDADVAYVLFSEQSNRALRYYGQFRPEAVDIVQDALKRSPNWALIHHDGQTMVFRSINRAG